MLRTSIWKIFLVLLIIILSIYGSIPSILTKEQEKRFSEYLPNTAINLGLDLRGGASLVLEVEDNEYYMEKIQEIADKISFILGVAMDSVKISDGSILVKISNLESKNHLVEYISKVKKALLDQMDVNDFSINNDQDIKEIRIDLKKNFRDVITSKLVSRSLETIQRRIDESGTKEILLQPQGKRHILLEVPGIHDTGTIKSLLGKTAKLTIHMVNYNVTKEDINRGFIPHDTKLLSFDQNNEGQMMRTGDKVRMIPVIIRPILSGDMLIDAQTSTDSLGRYVVQFRLNNAGAKIFAAVTAQNKGKNLAIVLDNKIISAPVINETIPVGVGVISGNFSMSGANELAVLLRSGALPAQLRVVEERSVGPSLGQASIDAGVKAVWIGCLSVMIIMFVFYGYWGLLANMALILNLVMMISVLGLIKATLTMPGIAGIALTLGMAVDANVLIFERIREEAKRGKSIISAIDSGYKIAMNTIFDSNITTIAATLVLYIFGSSAVRGFAITLTIGIICSVFTSVTVTKMIVVLWCRCVKLKRLGL